MKLLSVNMSLDPVTGGGTAERTIQMCKHFAEEGVECTILTTDIGLSRTALEAMKSANLNIIALPCINDRFYVPRLRLNLIKQLVTDSNVIHLMGHWTLINVIVYVYAMHLGKPYAVCPAGALPIFGRSSLLKIFYNKVAGISIIRNACIHVAIAENEIQQFADYGVAAEQVTLIPNGVNPVDYQFEDTQVFRNHVKLGDSPYILFVGRLNAIKGPDLLLHAFIAIGDLFPEMHLVFAGPDGGMLKELKSLLSDSAIVNRVHFPGYVGGANKIAAYKGATILVVPSRQEAMSIVALESGVCGVPVLVTDMCGFGTLSDIGGGMVVSATIEALSGGLVSLLENRGTLPRMGERFKTYILEHYTWHAAAIAYLDLFNKMG